MSVAALHPPAVVYREDQYFAWWVYALVALASALVWLVPACDARNAGNNGVDGWGPYLPVFLAFGLALPVLLTLGLLRMTTEVTPTDVRVWFGWVPTYRRSLPVAAIQRIELVRYRPLAEYRGWGIRSGPDGERLLSARGNQGVRLVLLDGSRLLIGSQRPEELARALERAMQPGI